MGQRLGRHGLQPWKVVVGESRVIFRAAWSRDQYSFLSANEDAQDHLESGVSRHDWHPPSNASSTALNSRASVAHLGLTLACSPTCDLGLCSVGLRFILMQVPVLSFRCPKGLMRRVCYDP